jgi:hypothetical protein
MTETINLPCDSSAAAAPKSIHTRAGRGSCFLKAQRRLLQTYIFCPASERLLFLIYLAAHYPVMEVRVPGQLTPFVYNESGFNIKERRERDSPTWINRAGVKKSRGGHAFYATAKGVSTTSYSSREINLLGQRERSPASSISLSLRPFLLSN